jgi:hypothetical protein
VQLHFTFPSFMSPRSYIGASGAKKPEPRQEIAGAFFLQLLAIAVQRGREINNPDAVNLQSLWN